MVAVEIVTLKKIATVVCLLLAVVLAAGCDAREGQQPIEEEHYTRIPVPSSVVGLYHGPDGEMLHGPDGKTPAEVQHERVRLPERERPRMRKSSATSKNCAEDDPLCGFRGL